MNGDDKVMSLRAQTCRNCGAAHQESVVVGTPIQCRLNPPSIAVMGPGGLIVAYPQVQTHFWCAQWRPKAQALNS